MQNQLLQTNHIVLFGEQAAGTTALTSNLVDMQDYDICKFVTVVASLTSGQTKGVISVNGGNLANGSDQAPLAGATLTISDNAAGKSEIIELVKPVGVRYLQLVITRNSQSAAIASVVAELTTAHKKPVNQDASNDVAVIVIDPQYVTTGLTTTTSTYGNSTTQVVTTARTSS